MDRLTEADYLVGVLTEDEQFTYDKLGNRESVNLRDGTDQDYAVNSLTNRYDNDAGEDIVCEYDEDGNTIVDPNGYQYAYDYENRIVAIKDKDEAPVAEYAYDALGRRIEVYDMVAETKTRYYYNNNWQVLTETNGSGVKQRSYIYGNYIDEALVMIDHTDSDVEYYYAHDHLYSPAALMESDGDIVERYEYDAYGHVTRFDPDFTEWSGEEVGNPYYFTGRRVDVLDDENLILQYSRNRYYEYYTGRMLTHDPFGVIPNALKPNKFIIIDQYQDGLNLYEYVKSSPVVYTDSTGLKIKFSIKCSPWQEKVLQAAHDAVEARLPYIKSELEKFTYDWVIENYVEEENRDQGNKKQQQSIYEGHNFWMNNVFRDINIMLNVGVKVTCECKCPPTIYAYYKWWKIGNEIHFCPDFFWGKIFGKPVTPEFQAVTFLHELSHWAIQTQDYGFSWRPKMNVVTMTWEGGDLTKAHYDAYYLELFQNEEPEIAEKDNVWTYIWPEKR